MALPDPDRQLVNAELQRQFSSLGLACGITKAQLRDAVNGIDNWCDANQSSFNAAIPLPARNLLSAEQKTLLLCYVARRRAGNLA